MAAQSKVAIVTGASRGIGKGCALNLAKKGFDVVVCARTVKEGTPIEHSSTVKKSEVSPLPGSLETTASEIEAVGGRALVAKLDLLNLPDVDDVVKATIDTFGRIDVVVNNARYIGPGHMDLVMDTPIEIFEQHLQCNVVAPLYLVQRAAPHMAKQGAGVVIHVTSGAGYNETAALPGEGGWGLGYSISKAAFNRIAAGLAKELRKDNIAVINLEPGFVSTERMVVDMGGFGFDASQGLSVDVPGLVCAYLATHPTPMAFSGRAVNAPTFVIEANLTDGTKFPTPYGPDHWGVPG